MHKLIVNFSLMMAHERFPTDGLTPQQDAQLESLLAMWGGGRISDRVFTRLAGMIPQPIVEVVVFGTRDELETLLIPRPQGDIVWPGMHHTPGTALRASDYNRPDKTPLNGAFERIIREIDNNFAYPPTYAGRLHRMSSRGPDVTEVYITELLEGSSLNPGQLWHPVTKLSTHPTFIQEQLGHVKLAAEAYRNRIKPN